jgi:hypothetical protein
MDLFQSNKLVFHTPFLMKELFYTEIFTDVKQAKDVIQSFSFSMESLISLTFLILLHDMSQVGLQSR